ncbi:MAG: beta-ketoacyl synthase N-terminal-like domain-containing protein, partial [Candidatus Rokuibacteriota bacterium]
MPSSGSTSSTSGAVHLRAEPVVIVAAGAITPIGGDLDAFWSGLVTGSDGITRIERFFVDDLRVGRGGEIKKLRVSRQGRAAGGRASQLLLAAADDLQARASIDARPDR